MTDDRIYELAKQHLGGKGHELVWQDDPGYAAACDMPKDARWSKNEVTAAQSLAFARAVLVAGVDAIAREWDGCMAPMFDPAENPTGAIDIGATIRASGGKVSDATEPEAGSRHWPDGKRMAARPCGMCLGLGCRMCKGTGRYEPAGMASTAQCPDCNGYGRVNDDSGARSPYGPKCHKCGGSGRVPPGVALGDGGKNNG